MFWIFYIQKATLYKSLLHGQFLNCTISFAGPASFDLIEIHAPFAGPAHFDTVLFLRLQRVEGNITTESNENLEKTHENDLLFFLLELVKVFFPKHEI